VRHRHLLGEEELAGVRIAPDLALGRVGGAKGDEVHERSGVHRPVELGVGADGDGRARELTGDSRLDEPLVGGVRGLVDGAQFLPCGLRQLVGHGLEGVGARLPDLTAHVLRLGDIKLVGGARVAHAELVERPDPVPEPLARDEERRPDVEAEGVVLERRAVAIAHEKADEPFVGLVHLLLAAREAHPRSVNHRQVGRHRVVEPDEPVIEDTDRVLGYDL
jgi:hypothetical protein